MKKIILTLILLIFAANAFAETNGGLAGAFGRLGAGARAKAMGNAYTGFAEGSSAIYFNPGALSFATAKEFSISHTSMALDRSMQYLAFTAPLKPKAQEKIVNAGVGIGWLHAGVSDIDSRNFDGAPLEMIDQSSNMFLFAFGIQFHEKFGAGITAKVIYETFGKIGNEEKSVNGDGFGVDAGLFAKPIEHLTVGAQIKDIGSKTTWSTTDYWSQGSSKTDKWPVQARVGAAYQYDFLVGALDVENTTDGDTRLHAGAEARHSFTDKQSVAIRAGVDKDNFNAGVGLGFSFWKLKSQVDFTYSFESVAPDDAQTVSWLIQF